MHTFYSKDTSQFQPSAVGYTCVAASATQVRNNLNSRLQYCWTISWYLFIIQLFLIFLQLFLIFLPKLLIFDHLWWTVYRIQSNLAFYVDSQQFMFNFNHLWITFEKNYLTFFFMSVEKTNFPCNNFQMVDRFGYVCQNKIAIEGLY